MRPIKHIHGDKAPQWIGDGFYVKTLINHLDDDPDINYRHTDPFLLFDYGQPTTFAPNPHYQTKPHGIGQHPHKGFEAVTVAYAGEISHADSAGGRGDILAGDAQWMTTGRGITHEEFHSEAFGARGGLFSMVQLWVNLPSAHKLTAPRYQSIKRADMPMVTLRVASASCYTSPSRTDALMSWTTPQVRMRETWASTRCRTRRGPSSEDCIRWRS